MAHRDLDQGDALTCIVMPPYRRPPASLLADLDDASRRGDLVQFLTDYIRIPGQLTRYTLTDECLMLS